MSDNNKLLRVENLKLYFRVKNGVVQAVDDVDFDLGYNEAIVIVGESGCGKTSFARGVLRLLPKNVDTYSGRIILDNAVANCQIPAIAVHSATTPLHFVAADDTIADRRRSRLAEYRTARINCIF